MQFLLLIVIRGKIGTPPVGRGSKMKSKICEKIALLHLCYLCAFSNLGGRGAEVAATYLGNTLFMGTKKKTSVMPVFCIVFLQLSLLNFSLCLVARFRALSNSSLRTNNECMYISIFSFLFIVCFFRLKVCGLLPLPSSKVWGERCLSHVIVHSHPHTHCSHCCK